MSAYSSVEPDTFERIKYSVIEVPPLSGAIQAIEMLVLVEAVRVGA